ncbi:MAG TPA: sigma-70 family RNA polymerase sigma factor, partial [bacterium]|nr:sigma-70 family RNA polymerase sigma factor [bacterium]
AHTYNDQGRFTSWMYRIAHNHCMDLFRRNHRMPVEEENGEPERADSILDRLESDGPSPRDLLMEQETFDMLEAAVGQLPEAIREVYILRAVHDVPFKEIAEIQNAPLGTVLSRMHQAVQRLRHILADEDASSAGSA